MQYNILIISTLLINSEVYQFWQDITYSYKYKQITLFYNIKSLQTAILHAISNYYFSKSTKSTYFAAFSIYPTFYRFQIFSFIPRKSCQAIFTTFYFLSKIFYSHNFYKPNNKKKFINKQGICKKNKQGIQTRNSNKISK